jgi:hypothetical protein
MATIPAQRSAALAGPEEKGRPASIPIDASQEVPWLVKTSTGSNVRVAQAGGPDVPRKVSFLGPQRLGVTLEADDVAAPGLLLFTVMNPEPGGGMSQSIPVSIDEADGAAERAAVGTPTAGEANGADRN